MLKILGVVSRVLLIVAVLVGLYFLYMLSLGITVESTPDADTTVMVANSILVFLGILIGIVVVFFGTLWVVIPFLMTVVYFIASGEWDFDVRNFVHWIDEIKEDIEDQYRLWRQSNYAE